MANDNVQFILARFLSHPFTLDFIVTANSREVLEKIVLPRINAFLEERGVRLSAEKTVITHIHQGFDFLGQTIRKHPRSKGRPAKLQITPSKASFQAIKARVKQLCRQGLGDTPEQLIDTLNPVLRGWANYHRYAICSQTFRQLDSFVWRRVYRWAKHRHPDKTGRWVAQRYFPHQPGESWRLTDPKTGKQLIRVSEAVKPQRYVKIKAHANPFAPEWVGYFQDRDRQLSLRASSPFRAKVLCRQQGRCPQCRQMIECEQEIELHHLDGNPRNNRIANLVFLHSNCHRQIHYAPDDFTGSPRPFESVGHA